MVEARCIGCGGVIVLTPYEVPAGVIARGDRLMHEGCVLDSAADAEPRTPGSPAFLIPRDW